MNTLTRKLKSVPAATVCPYLLTLAHGINSDIAHDERAGYWTPPTDPKRMDVPVTSLAEAARAFRTWVDRNGLGAGNLTKRSGEVRDSNGVVVAQVSYNGRVWEPGEWPTKEIVLPAVPSTHYSVEWAYPGYWVVTKTVVENGHGTTTTLSGGYSTQEGALLACRALSPEEIRYALDGAVVVEGGAS